MDHYGLPTNYLLTAFRNGKYVRELMTKKTESAFLTGFL